MVNFLTSRYLARGWMHGKLGQSGKFRALDKAVSAEGWRIIFTSRMSPIIPHSLVSYAAGSSAFPFGGLLSLRSSDFSLKAPPIPISVPFLARLRTSAGVTDHDPILWIFYCLGLVATLAVTVLTTRIARRSWKRYFAEPELSKDRIRF